jgi:ABC-type molybdate transport system substrate-binding protein
VPGKVKVIKMPAWAQPKVAYGMCIVSSSSNKAAATDFVNRVVAKAGQAKLLSAGFLPRAKPKPKKKH